MARHQMRSAHSGGNAVQKGRSVRKKTLPKSRWASRRAVRQTKWQLPKRAMDKGSIQQGKGARARIRALVLLGKTIGMFKQPRMQDRDYTAVQRRE